MSGSQVTLAGNLTRDPEIKFTASGSAVASFSVACNRSWKGRDGNWQEEVSYVEVTAWGQLADNVVESVRKGDMVIVEGRIKQDSWTQSDGTKRSKLTVTANEVGACMSRATVTVSRNERRSPGDSSQPAPAYDPDEEPF